MSYVTCSDFCGTFSFTVAPNSSLSATAVTHECALKISAVNPRVRLFINKSSLHYELHCQLVLITDSRRVLLFLFLFLFQ
jgi:hypothetical protein